MLCKKISWVLIVTVLPSVNAKTARELLSLSRQEALLAQAAENAEQSHERKLKLAALTHDGRDRAAERIEALADQVGSHKEASKERFDRIARELGHETFASQLFEPLFKKYIQKTEQKKGRSTDTSTFFDDNYSVIWTRAWESNNYKIEELIRRINSFLDILEKKIRNLPGDEKAALASPEFKEHRHGKPVLERITTINDFAIQRIFDYRALEKSTKKPAWTGDIIKKLAELNQRLVKMGLEIFDHELTPYNAPTAPKNRSA